MPTFTYTGRDQHGTVQAGQLEALTEEDVVKVLQRRGLLVTSVIPRQPVRALAVRRARASHRMHGRVTIEDHVQLCQQLATLVEAGVPLLRSLEVVSAQSESRSLFEALEQIRRDVAGGGTLRQALSRHASIFSPMWLNLVETGEASGHLAQSLNQLAHHFELTRHIQNEARTALTYPAFLGLAAVAVVALFVYWLIPKFAGIFTSMQMELPPLTRLVMAFSEVARRYYVVVILGAAGAVYLLRRYLRTEGGRWVRDRMALRLPVFRSLFAAVQLAGFARGLATLLDSGVPLLSGLSILEHTATNNVYARAIGRVREAVKEGQPMVEPMAEAEVFPPMVVQMVQVGEEVGELGKMAVRIAKYYEERVDMFIARMTRLFEPIAIVVMAGLIFFIVLSIFMPIFQMAASARG